MTPVSIKRHSPTELRITWDDGHISLFTFGFLRDNCPCASCSGETVLLREYHAPAPDKTTPGRYELKGIEQVGAYAIQLLWADGHNTGIYSWEYLRDSCQCKECTKDL